MRHFDTEALAAFSAVADTGSFTIAAERLGKTQAAVSMSVSRLENRLGQQLFQRSRRGIVLTETGQRLLVHARRIHQVEAAAIADLIDHMEDCRVVLGMPDDYISTFGSALIERFSPLNPSIRIDLECRFSRTLEAMADSRQIDIAIVTQDPQRPRGEFLRHERQFFCTGASGRPEERECLQLALFSKECPSRPSIANILDRSGRDWQLSYSSSHLAGIQLAAASGNLITVLPEAAIPTGWRILGPAEGLPELPPLPLAIVMGKNANLPERRVAAFLQREFGREPTIAHPATAPESALNDTAEAPLA